MHVKTLNPFVPAVPLITLPNRSQRERFRTWFFTVLTAHVALFLFLLLKDYRDELIASARSLPEAMAGAAVQTTDVPVAAPNPSTENPASPQAALAAPSPRPAAAASSDPASADAEGVYVVKAGDTLSQIARACGTTVKALKAANNLGTERLVIGQKLRLSASTPSAAAPLPAMTGSL